MTAALGLQTAGRIALSEALVYASPIPRNYRYAYQNQETSASHTENKMDTFFKLIDRKDYFPHTLLLQWLIFISVITAAFWMAWKYGLIQNIIKTDPSYLSVVIALIFLGGTMHCLLRILALSRELNILHRIIADSRSLTAKDQHLLLGDQTLPPSLLTNYLGNAIRHRTAVPGRKESSALEAVFAEKINGSHESGWFFTGLLLKLGLLGTVIGFILMLTSVANLGSVDPEHIYQLFSEMTYGMRVALNTTLAGLVGTILLGLQYLTLDRAADKLLSDTTQLLEQYLI